MKHQRIKPFKAHGDSDDAEPLGYSFHCPGCKRRHMMYTREPNTVGAKWTFNGDMEKPTFRPSFGLDMNHPESRCHSFLTDGNIQFLADCGHDFAGKTVPLVPDPTVAAKPDGGST